MKSKFYVLAMVALLFVSCNGEGDRDLGNGYYYLPANEAVDMGYPYGSIIYRSGAIDQFTNILVYADIDRIVHNSEHILLVQRPNVTLLLDRIDDDIDFWKKQYATNNRDTTVSLLDQNVKISRLSEPDSDGKILDSLLSNSPAYKLLSKNASIYYLIDKRNGMVKPFVAKNDLDVFLQNNKIQLKL